MECFRLHEQPCPGVRYHSERFDFVQGFYMDGYGNLEAGFERNVIYVRGIAFLVVDKIEVQDSRMHVFTQHWHFGKEYQREHFRLSESQVETMEPAGPNLWCHSFSKEPLTAKLYYGEKNPYRGWYVIDYNDMVPAAEVEYSWQGKGNQTVVTLLYPHRGAEAGVELKENAFGFTVQFADERKISFVWETNGFLIEISNANTIKSTLRYDGEKIIENIVERENNR